MVRETGRAEVCGEVEVVPSIALLVSRCERGKGKPRAEQNKTPRAKNAQK